MKALFCLLLAVPALAQTPEPPAREVKFDEADLVEGTGQAPDIDEVSVRQRERARSLVKVRADFRTEMLRSADDI